MFVMRVKVGAASLAWFFSGTGPQLGPQGVTTPAHPEGCEKTSDLLYALTGAGTGGATKQASDPKRHQVEERILGNTRNQKQGMAQSAKAPLALLASARNPGLDTTACRVR